jgi:hypothetical protein
MIEANQSCKARLRQFLRNELADWSGLPSNCAETDVVQWVSTHPGEGVAHLGSEAIEYRFRAVQPPEPDAVVRLYFRDAVLHLVRTDYGSADRAVHARLLKSLEEPAERLDLAFGTGLIGNGAWIYPARGLMLGVVPDTQQIVRAMAYAPCTVETYRLRLHDAAKAREFRGRQ